MMLAKIDEGLYLNPQFIAVVAKQGKIGHPMDQDPSKPNMTLIQMMSGMMIQTTLTPEEIYDQVEGLDYGKL